MAKICHIFEDGENEAQKNDIEMFCFFVDIERGKSEAVQYWIWYDSAIIEIGLGNTKYRTVPPPPNFLSLAL